MYTRLLSETRLLIAARDEAKRFVKSCEAAIAAYETEEKNREAYLKSSPNAPYGWEAMKTQTKNATAKRHSMDLSHALVALRNR